MKGNLDISILVDEFDAHIEAFQNASDVARDAFENDIVFHLCFFILVYDIFKDNSDHGDDSNEECSKGKGSKMVSKSPLDGNTYSDWALILSIGSVRSLS